MAPRRAFGSLGISGNPGLLTILIASSGQPVAQTAQPKHRSRSTTGTSSSPMLNASGGHRSMQMSQALHWSASNTGWNPELKNTAGLLMDRAVLTAPQCQRSQLQMNPTPSAV